MDPYQENTKDAPESDYRAEGFEFLKKAGIKVMGHPVDDLWWVWRRYGFDKWVVRFELVEVL